MLVDPAFGEDVDPCVTTCAIRARGGERVMEIRGICGQGLRGVWRGGVSERIRDVEGATRGGIRIWNGRPSMHWWRCRSVEWTAREETDCLGDGRLKDSSVGRVLVAVGGESLAKGKKG
jgi:hypothetical protein